MLLLATAVAVPATGAPGRPSPNHGARPLLLAHYMPWYEAKPYSGRWGWHWTMGRFNPDRLMNGRPEIASHYTPLIGPYDSADPAVLECQVLLMKLAGIDGVVLDWYGPDDFLDYAIIHRNAEKLIPYLKRAGLRFAVCYEDQTVRAMVDAKKLQPQEAVEHGRRVMRWLQDYWFRDPDYIRLDGKPLLLVFGPQYYSGDQWTQILSALAAPPAFFTLHHRRGPAIGAFDWPLPAPDQGLKAVEAFYQRAAGWPAFIPVAFPRFHDIYREAGIHPSYGQIPDEDGRTFRSTLERALRSRARMVQIATWNDWGEGTQIEPSVEFDYRDLDMIQALRRKNVEPELRFRLEDLKLPIELLKLRWRFSGVPQVQIRLDAAAEMLNRGDTGRARTALKRIGSLVAPRAAGRDGTTH